MTLRILITTWVCITALSVPARIGTALVLAILLILLLVYVCGLSKFKCPDCGSGNTRYDRMVAAGERWICVECQKARVLLPHFFPYCDDGPHGPKGPPPNAY